MTGTSRRTPSLAGVRLTLLAGVIHPGAYTVDMTQDRIVADHRIMGGVPCIRGTRIPVATIVGLVAVGQGVTDILADYPQLNAADIRAALEFAAFAVAERQLPLRTPA